jgi:hypothetical protein
MKTEETMTEPTDPRYKRVQQATLDLKSMLKTRPSEAEINGAISASDDCWKKSIGGMLQSSRLGEHTEAWAAAFEQLREAKSAVLGLRWR